MINNDSVKIILENLIVKNIDIFKMRTFLADI